MVVDNGSDDGSVELAPQRSAERARDHVTRQRRLRARREPRHRRDPRADRGGPESRPHDGSRARRRRCWRASTPNRPSARAGRASATSTVPTTRRRGDRRSVQLAVMHGLFGLWWPTNPFTTRYRQLNADPERAALGRLGLRRGDVAPAHCARRGRRVGRAVLHVHGGSRPVLAASARWFRRCVRARRRGHPRTGCEHFAHSVPNARPAPPVGLEVRAASAHGRERSVAAVRGRISRRAGRLGDGRARLACLQAQLDLRLACSS